MYIAVKDTKIIGIHEVEWECRKLAKGLDTPSYMNWLKTVTSGDPPVPDYSGENYEVKEAEVDVQGFNQSGHIVYDIYSTHYHLKWDDSKVVKDDDAFATFQLAEKWKDVRSQRDRLLNETDWVVTKATETGVTVSSAWKTYRQKLRDVPSQSDPDDITWPTKPE